jgi:NAD(P) transhydrogenase subunit alpha
MFAKNLVTFLLHLAPKGELAVDANDEIARDTLVTGGGDIVNARVRELLGLPAVQAV